MAASARRHRRRVSPAAATDMLRTQRVAAANLTIAFLADAAAFAVPAPPVARTRHVDASSGTDTSPAAPTLMDVPASTIRRAVNRARKRARSTAGLGEGRSLSPARRAVPRRPRTETIPSVMAQGHVMAQPAPSASPAAAASRTAGPSVRTVAFPQGGSAQVLQVGTPPPTQPAGRPVVGIYRHHESGAMRMIPLDPSQRTRSPIVRTRRPPSTSAGFAPI